MAKIGAVKLKIDVKGAYANTQVVYTLTFSKTDQKNKQTYKEIVRLIGDDTQVGDPAAGGADDVLGFLSPINNKRTAPAEGDLALERVFTKRYKKSQLDEDKGGLAGPDEIRALVTLVPLPATPDGKVVQRQSNMIRREMGA